MQRTMIVSAVFALLVVTGGTAANAAEKGVLQGSWTLGETDCSEIFMQSEGGTKFINRESSLNTGIIIRDDTMTGPHSSCTIGGITKHQDVYKVRLMCSTAIMFDDISVLLKVVDDDHFSRIDPDFPEISRTYKRCSP